MKSPLFLLLVLISVCSFAQDTGLKTYPHLGISFEIPDGWKGQETEYGYVIGSDSKAGFIVLLRHDYNTIEAIKTQARQGIYDDEGTALRLESGLDSIHPGAIGARFVGTIEWSSVKAYIISVLNPFGSGVTVLAATSPDTYDESYENLSRKVAASLKFKTPVEPPVVKEMG